MVAAGLNGAIFGAARGQSEGSASDGDEGSVSAMLATTKKQLLALETLLDYPISCMLNTHFKYSMIYIYI